jgi:hypothetical protein
LVHLDSLLQIWIKNDHRKLVSVKYLIYTLFTKK